jgi:hypothetical protein
VSRPVIGFDDDESSSGKERVAKTSDISGISFHSHISSRSGKEGQL